MRYSLFSVVILLFLFLASCKNKPTGLGPSDVISGNDNVYIVDATGKKWDVTHAQEKYGMVPSQYQYGLGPYAIQPINNPTFLSPGDPGYPKYTDSFMVMGVTLHGESRAYPMIAMGTHEVVNDWFGNVPVAITN
jgi:hypothetical protein